MSSFEVKRLIKTLVKAFIILLGKIIIHTLPIRFCLFIVIESFTLQSFHIQTDSDHIFPVETTPTSFATILMSKYPIMPLVAC